MKTIGTHRLFKYVFRVLFGTGMLSPWLEAQWVMQYVPTMENLTDVAMLDSVTAIVIGDRNAILRTTDAGVTWTNITIAHSTPYHWNAISFSGKKDGIVVGDQTVWTTSDGGINWIPRALPSTHKCLSVLCISPSHIYIGSDSGYIHRSLDAGSSWTSVKASTWEIRSLFVWRGASVFALPLFALTPFSILSNSEFPYSQWSENTLEQMRGLASGMFDGEFSYGGGPGYLVGVQGDLRADPTILVKKMSDTVWTKVQTGILRDGELYGVSAPSEKVAYVCGSNGMIFKSSDGGVTWSDMNVPTKRRLKAIYFFNNERGFAVGDSGTVLFTSNGGITSVAEEALEFPEQFELLQNYPNPFNSTTTITFIVGTNARLYNKKGNELVSIPTKLIVYDVLGREVAMLVNEELSAGKHSVQWNATGMSSGIYFYRLQAGNDVSTRKLFLVK